MNHTPLSAYYYYKPSRWQAQENAKCTDDDDDDAGSSGRMMILTGFDKSLLLSLCVPFI